MKAYDSEALRMSRRPLLFGVLFMVVGLSFLAYGAWHLFGIYIQPAPMFELEVGLSPEKGMMWAKCLAGGSVALLGGLMIFKAKMDGKTAEKSE
ncbi:MAG: hypothetical protein C4548_10240 [Desulfobacteraceae bacterium]|jgi:hypothetical protein|nr:MAG: hypothetical protein C4548_10240 [Desulfobacteraceae bacterium]